MGIRQQWEDKKSSLCNLIMTRTVAIVGIYLALTKKFHKWLHCSLTNSYGLDRISITTYISNVGSKTQKNQSNKCSAVDFNTRLRHQASPLPIQHLFYSLLLQHLEATISFPCCVTSPIQMVDHSKAAKWLEKQNADKECWGRSQGGCSELKQFALSCLFLLNIV